MVFSFFIWQLGRRGEDWARAIGSGRTGAWRSTYLITKGRPFLANGIEMCHKEGKTSLIKNLSKISKFLKWQCVFLFANRFFVDFCVATVLFLFVKKKKRLR